MINIKTKSIGDVINFTKDHTILRKTEISFSFYDIDITENIIKLQEVIRIIQGMGRISICEETFSLFSYIDLNGDIFLYAPKNSRYSDIYIKNGEVYIGKSGPIQKSYWYEKFMLSNSNHHNE